MDTRGTDLESIMRLMGESQILRDMGGWIHIYIYRLEALGGRLC